MTDKAGQQQRVNRYLLRQMPEEERVEFEDQYFADSELFDELVAVDDQIIGAWLRGECSEEDRKQLAAQFTTPAGRQRVEFAQAWMDYISAAKARDAGVLPEAAPATQKNIVASAQSRPKGTWHWARSILTTAPVPMRLGIAAVGLIAIMGGSWMAMMNVHLRWQVAQIEVERQDIQRQQQQLRDQLAALAAQLRQQQRVESEQQQVIAQLESVNLAGLPFVLAPRLTRGGDSQKPLVVTPGAQWVRLQVNLPYDDCPVYSVSLETPEGGQVWHKESLKAQMRRGSQPAIMVNLPTNGLQSRTYVLRVKGFANNGTESDVGDYSFRMAKR